MNRKIILIAAIIVGCLSSCTKKDPPTDNSSTFGKVEIEFKNVVGTGNLVLNTQWYTNQHGDSFNVSMFKYYISNIVLNGTKSYTEQESYHLINQELSSSHKIDLDSIPSGQYNSITLMIGVDSLRNVSGAQTGALDPVNDMFWTWSTGYIMLKLEGKSPESPASDDGIRFHAGGFSGAYPTQRTVTLNFSSPITISKNTLNHIHINADVLALFKSPNVIDFSTVYSVNSKGADAKNLADNYANMLSITYSGL